jgi:hypothetical protein
MSLPGTNDIGDERFPGCSPRAHVASFESWERKDREEVSMLKIAVVVAVVGLLVSGCRPVDPSQALVDGYCTALEEARTNEKVIERLYKVYEVPERAGELGMKEEEFGKAVEDRCGEAVREASRVARANEEAREEEQRALLGSSTRRVAGTRPASVHDHFRRGEAERRPEPVAAPEASCRSRPG